MIEMFTLMKWVLIAGVLWSAVLTWLGGHLSTRDKTMQTLCLSQSAVLGTLLGLVWAGTESAGQHIPHHDDPFEHLWPIIFAFGMSGLAYLISEKLLVTCYASRNSVFAAFYALLIACAHLVSALFPGLENHLTHAFLGELATLPEPDAIGLTGVALSLLVILFQFRHALMKQSIDTALFGTPVEVHPHFFQRHGFKILELAVVSVSVHLVGLLFTLGLLFLPTVLVSYLPVKGLRRQIALSIFMGSLGTLIGFLLTLKFTQLPTVPTILAVIVVTAGMGVSLQLVFCKQSSDSRS